MSTNPELGSERRTPRAQVYMAGELVTPMGRMKATIRDISLKGAHIASEHELKIGSVVELKRAALSAEAHVAWVRGREAGLEFVEPLTRSVLERSMPKALLQKLDVEQAEFARPPD